MKNRILTLLLAGAALIGATQAKAQYQFKVYDFLTGSNLLVNAQSTNAAYGSTNVYLKYGSSFGPGYTTNTPTVNTTNAQAFQDVATWVNRDGTTPDMNFKIELQGGTSASTNAAILQFVGLPGPPRSATPTLGGQSWTVSLLANTNALVVFTTNPPAFLFKGNGAIRCTFVNSTNNGDQLTIRKIQMVGQSPN